MQKHLIAALKIMAEDDYRGEHEAPTREGGAPMHDLTGTYPDDIYSAKALEMYGGYRSDDREALNIIQDARGKPAFRVKIYRAVPKILTVRQKIDELEKQKAYILKHGKVPPQADTTLDSSDYYDKIYDEIEKLEKMEDKPVEKPKISKGNWIALTKGYARDHGHDNLNNRYRILTKTVKAKDLYTDGNSLQEWGYDPS